MNLWYKIEDLLNFILGKVFDWIGPVLFPAPARRFFIPIITRLELIWEKLKIFIQQFKIKSKQKLISTLGWLIDFPSKILPAFNSFMDLMSEFNWDTINPKKYIVGLFPFILKNYRLL
ncbi:MAG: hypothetical protein WCG27_05220, partial [Pseudomonadota bacterium]